jgi:hypothetical protein
VVAVLRLGRVLFVVVAAAALAGTTPARADAQASLTGESFLGGTFFGEEPVDVQATCNPEGVSTIKYSTPGLAFGPYPGTYFETGTVQIGPQDLPRFISGFQVGPLVHVEARFKIFSALGFVTGTKSLLADPDDAFGACYEISESERFISVCACGRFSLSYDAVIATELGLFRDEGKSGFILEDVNVSGFRPTNLFNEAFESDRLTPLASTPGLATGGGQILSTSPGVTFGFEARSDGQTTQGHCEVVDHRSDTKIVCLDVDTYVQTGNGAIFFGDALINGEPERYRIEVVDNGESGIAKDFFGIVVLSDIPYVAEGVLTEGDIEVHPQAAS